MTKKKIYLFEIFLMIYYAWFTLPVMRAVFDSSIFKLAFFACFAIGCALIIYEMWITDKRIKLSMTALVPVLIYMAFILIMALFNIDDASKHVRISLTFWGTILVFFLLSDFEESKIRLGKFLLLLFVITAITSAVGVITDNSAARAITDARSDASEDYGLMVKNISGIYLFQGLVMFVPILLSFAKGKFTIPCLIILAVILFALISASFAISILMFFIAVALFFLFKKGGAIKQIILACLVIGVMFIPWVDILNYLARVIENQTVASRIKEVSNFISQGDVSGDLALRIECYEHSIKTFIQNPFGVGAHYSYVIGDNGIGYHSSLLDNLARYGIFAIIFFVAFFVLYYKIVAMEWAKIGKRELAIPIVIVWVLFTALNLAFRSADESIVTLFIIPILPSVILRFKERFSK